MKALRWHDRGDIRLEDIELDEELPAGQVEIEVAYCGICGSDVAEYSSGPVAIKTSVHGLTGAAPPITLGHEFSGRVVAVGSAVTGIKVGARVAADASWRCGSCEECRAGRYNLCAQGASIGLASDGGMAERVRVPAYCVVPLPDGVSDQAGALLEPLAVGLHALDRGAARPAQTVVVIGYGPIGAGAAEVARACGLDVLVLEPHDGRRRRAESLKLATYVPLGDARDDARAVRSMTGGGAHLVIDCTGAPSSIANAPEMTRRGGNIVVVGIPKAAPQIDIARLILFERRLIGALGYRHDLPRVAAMIASGTLAAEAMITRVAGLSESNAMFERLATDPGDDLKILLDPRS